MYQRFVSLALVALLIGSAAGSAAAASPAGTNQQASASAYAGAHVSFDVAENAVTDYAVENATVFQSVAVQSQSKAASGGVLSGSLSSAVRIDAAGLALGSTTRTSATVRADSGATIRAHDNGHGILTVSSGSESQVVVANLSNDASASAEDDGQVAVTAGDGTEGTFLVVGDGTVSVNEQGNVTATLDENATLVFRSYPDGKSESDDHQERLIANGTAAGEAYVMTQGGESVTDSVNYTSDFTVTATQSAENEVTVTADHAESRGKVVITSVTERAVGTLSDVRVAVDGNAAAKATTYGELTDAIGSDRSRYMVRETSSASASASADVLIAFNHFSERQATLSGGNESTDSTTASDSTTSTTASDSTASTTASDSTTAGDGSETTQTNSPGFGVLAALVAFAGVALARRRRA
ncbi:PGF-CTERM sorting domain-containing protein [Halocalculus aciditolerans]|uniref:PGF-CTERM sorting domain-containing protein n=1 Tax=Halocalculus aciditolerans TaxID=1383812 RepID=A0A830FMH4_9EURY|nr:PGF-CTERM sorting domain-containing protein [Halocalculus aciditolerans]GGL70376.1 hypothetical protein GCM10009039_30550 [Halocalculus aciditolerans]